MEVKTLFLRFPFMVIFTLGLSNCVTYSVKRSLLISPLPQNAAKVTESGDKGEIRIKPFFYQRDKSSLVFRDEKSYGSQSNVHWKIPFYSFGGNVSWNISEHIGIESSLLYSNFSDRSFFSEVLGLGFRRTFFGKLGVRIDNLITAYNQEYKSDLVEENDDVRTDYSKQGNRVYYGVIHAVTLNTLPEFLGLNYLSSVEFDYYKYFFHELASVTSSLGIYKNFSSDFRVIGTVRHHYFYTATFQESPKISYGLALDFKVNRFFRK